MEELLLFQVGTLQLGIDLAYIKSIQSAKPDFAEQGNKKCLTQVVDGKEIPLYDLLSIFEKGATLRKPNGEKVIAVESQNQSMGLIVDRIKQVVPVDNDQIKSLSPIFREPSLACFPNVLKHDNQLILLFTPEGLTKANLQAQESQEYSDIPDTEISSHLMKKSSEQEYEKADVIQQNPAPIEDELKIDINTTETIETNLSSDFTSSVKTEEQTVTNIEHESDLQASDCLPEPSIDFAEIDKQVCDMLDQNQLTAVVEKLATETVKKANLKDIMNKLFTQAIEDLSFKIRKRKSAKQSQVNTGVVSR